MTHLSSIPRIADDGCGFFTDIPATTHDSGDSAGRASSTLPASRNNPFPVLHDVHDDVLAQWEREDFETIMREKQRFMNRAAKCLQAALVVLLFGVVTLHYAGMSDFLTGHPDPVEVGQ